MTFGDYVKKGWEIIKLNASVMSDVSKDESAFAMAIAFIALAGVATAIGTINIFGIIINPIFTVILSFIGYGILHIIALLFGGKGTFKQLYSVLGIAALIQWVTVVPIAGPIVGFVAALWTIVITVVALKVVHTLSTVKAVIVVLIPIIIGIVLMVVLAAFFATMLAAAGGSAFGSLAGLTGALG